ncbi:glucuronate isomerase [Chitinophaga tropicalis]|uniref:Uronate isomerase n=1 Tax=Chitinophaga tropicalis TaxID=2683588 RepID=A0A7K1U8T8_9BACT|nr:glucuronate isomerase [Chitinophaga tropicalis]MVT10736.1 glucuronate isomerase [Chitinophaga tropicalis]
MKQFLDADFLLRTETAKRLFHDYAKEMPVIDYHNHLPPDEIAADRQFENLTAAWLKGDHYKWRAMRANGVAEEDITGNTDDFTRFKRWAATVPYTMRNPLYHWTHMELLNPFGVKQLLDADSAEFVYNHCNEQLPRFTTRALLEHFKVDTLCTTDDPCDTLEYHQAISQSGFKVKVLPTFRPDKAIGTEDVAAFNVYADRLGTVAGRNTDTYTQFMDALHSRHDYFHANGGRLSDHGISTFYAADFTMEELTASYAKLRSGKLLTAAEANTFKAGTLHFICEWNHERGWVQQFHVGAIRNNNSRLMKRIGADAGVDSIGDWQVAQAMSAFLDGLDKKDKLAKTVVYNLNPAYNEVFATMVGNFQDGTVPGKMQFGSGWWFLDQKDGMEKQMNALSNMGLLSRFVGMLTDSRSFLSYSRHEYFRRILCNLIGNDVENGELPADINWLGKMVQDISYNNAKTYFGF